MRIFSLFAICMLPFCAFSTEIKTCYIKDAVKHASNQRILERILDREFKNFGCHPEEHAQYLRQNIQEIAKQLNQNGFWADAYALPELTSFSTPSYKAFVLWEGKHYGNIPVTFFVYVWPPEESARQYPNQPTFYATSIHKHPIPCAFAVLKGMLVQKNFCEIPYQYKKAICVQEESFQEGEGDCDELQQAFIHQLYGKGSFNSPALSLHAYGLSSKKEVWQCFDATSEECTYFEKSQLDRF